MQVNIEVVQISDVKRNTKGKGSNYIELTYKDLDNRGAVKGMRLVDFGDYKHLFNEVQEYSVGDTLTMQIEKIKDFWNIVAFGDEKVEVKEKPVKEETAKGDPKATPGPAQKWVPDEVRQRLIVRQSSLAQAVAFEAQNSPSVQDVLTTADTFFNWVFEQEDATPAKASKKVKTEVE